jgi:hypothetical protein
VQGVSIIQAQHGTEDERHFFLTVGQETKFSQTINTGFMHGTLKLGLETYGPTEIGGLILDPDFRKSDKKLGKQIGIITWMLFSSLLLFFYTADFIHYAYVHQRLNASILSYIDNPLISMQMMWQC